MPRRADGTYELEVAGIFYGDLKTYPEKARQLVDHTPLELKRDPRNEHDPNAVEVWWRSLRLGFVGRLFAAEIAAIMDAGVPLTARVFTVLPHGQSWIVRIEISGAPR